MRSYLGERLEPFIILLKMPPKDTSTASVVNRSTSVSAISRGEVNTREKKRVSVAQSQYSKNSLFLDDFINHLVQGNQSPDSSNGNQTDYNHSQRYWRRFANRQIPYTLSLHW